MIGEIRSVDKSYYRAIQIKKIIMDSIYTHAGALLWFDSRGE